MRTSDKIYIAGHRGMVGSAIVRYLTAQGYQRLLVKTRHEVDLCDRSAVHDLYATERPDIAIIAAAKVGGILANSSYPVEFMTENLAIAANCIQAAHATGTRRLLFLGSSCIYPRDAPQPMPENCLLTSPLEQTNEAYALAKICGLKLCHYYRRQYGVLFHSAMPTNLYGPGDNYHPEHSHVLPALIRKVHEAKQRGADHVILWGSGTPRREFLHVDDLAAACAHLLGLVEPPDWVNVGTGTDISILELAELICRIVGFTGEVRLDPSRPDGTPRKLMDVSLLTKTGWTAQVDLEEGIRQTYQCFIREHEDRTIEVP